MEPEVRHGETEGYTRVKLEAVRLIKERGVSYVQAAQELGVHQSVLRTWVKAFADDPQHAFPGQGQMKPEQLEIAQLRGEVAKLRAERDILKNFRRPRSSCGHRNGVQYDRRLRGAAVGFLVVSNLLKNMVHGLSRT